MSDDDGTTPNVPYYLMPVAAVLGMYALLMGIRLMYLLYLNVTYNSKTTLIPPSIRLLSKDYAILVVTFMGALLGYAKIVASLETALMESEYALFDPYEILNLSTTTLLNETEIKAAYRTLSKQTHPDKPNGSEAAFQKVHMAYRALTTDYENYQEYGHPDGMPTSQTLAFALPEWLLHPTGTVAIVLIVLYMSMFVGLIYVVYKWSLKSETQAKVDAKSMSVAGADTAYLASNLSPTSTHLDILFCIATTPESILVTEQALERIDELRSQKMAKKKAGSKNNKNNNNNTNDDAVLEFDLDDAGWDDNDGDEDAAKELAEEEKKKQELRQLAEANGNLNTLLLEGVDEGVLGQTWVEDVMEKKGKNWPPPIESTFLKGKTFSTTRGKVVTALEHRAIRRNLCFTIGRLNSMLLNTHPDLLESHSKKLIDQTYFKGSLEFRQRAGLLLEAALRVAAGMQSYRLAKTIVETVAMFKVGVMEPSSALTLKWFEATMRKQYGAAGVPQLGITELKVETAGEDEIATGDTCTLSYTMDRLHAENFTKVKLALCQKQGIPPQVALQTYREGWWFLVRAKKVDGGETPLVKPTRENPLLTVLQSSANYGQFESERGENRLVVAWPMICQNMAQKTGKIKIQFKAPAVAGKYKILIAIKSQEFLGSDQEFEVPITVVDAATVERKEEEEEDEEDKKDK